MTKNQDRSEQYVRQVADELMEQIKAGVAPWQKPWKPGEKCISENLATGKSYTGGNSIYLMSRGIRQGHGDNRWGTYKQIEAAGGHVRKGERGTKVLFYTDRARTPAKDEAGKPLKDKDGKPVYEEYRRSHPVVRQYTVFNVEQADGLNLPPREAQAPPEWKAHADAEAVIARQRSAHQPRCRRSSLLQSRQRSGGAAGTRAICHGQRLLPDGAARTGPRHRPRKPLESENAARRYCGGLRERSLRARRTAGGDQRHDDGPDESESAMILHGAQPTSRTGSRCSRRSRARFTTRPAKRRKSPTTSPNRCAIELPKRRRSMVSWRRSTPTKPGRRSATHPAPRRKRKHRNWNGTQAPVASPVRITDV